MHLQPIFTTVLAPAEADRLAANNDVLYDELRCDFESADKAQQERDQSLHCRASQGFPCFKRGACVVRHGTPSTKYRKYCVAVHKGTTVEVKQNVPFAQTCAGSHA